MGYDTRYRLTVSPADALPPAAQATTFDDGFCDLAALLRGVTFKWYEHERDMRGLSEIYPEAIFTLRGEGDDAGDVWIKYFKAGRMQESRMPTFHPDPFDPEKLK